MSRKWKILSVYTILKFLFDTIMVVRPTIIIAKKTTDIL